MFKKRTIRRSKSDAKRKLDFESDGSGSETNSEASIRIPQREFKKRKHPNGKNEGTTSKSSVGYFETSSKKEAEPVIQGLASDENSKPSSTLKGAPQNIRTITITDFQPDVCKDFLQTGYCGYGDTCKFLHIRDESRQKKPIEKEWENVTKTKAKPNPKVDQIPFKCVLCKEDYKKPVKTTCEHIFCQTCLLSRIKSKNKTTCFICGKETGGIFSSVLPKELDSLIS
ncbi:uncharacterized protein PRCAT00003244001 [Priceomyces carsonii]|uniref:uncharacterized protein n=1 Tax=Priceomyces carsonii TaxID=28549 RepID=UPI002EDB6F26|nr:unnamed protein product [Priceomyces carsonii]